MKNNQDLEKLLSQFMDQPEVQQAADDIVAGDRLFERYPAPPVSQQALQRIRCDVAKRTRLQRLFGGLSFAGSAAAAAVIVFALLQGPRTNPVGNETIVASAHKPVSNPAVAAPERPRDLPPPAVGLWNRLASHELLHQIDRELTDVADSIDAIKSESYKGFVNTLKIDLLELEELELLTASSDFWKG
jgi:hypothetical protein